MHGQGRVALRGSVLIVMTTLVSKSQLRRQAVWVVGCRIVGIAATVASNILAARLLRPAELATYLLATPTLALRTFFAIAPLNEPPPRLISHRLPPPHPPPPP